MDGFPPKFLFSGRELKPLVPCPLQKMSMLRTAAIRSARANARPALKLSRPSAAIKPTPRFYSSHPASHSNPTGTTNWFVGSLIVFGPLLFYLTSPPASKKQHGHADHAPSLVHKIEDAVAVVKAPTKPYVLVGSGTASFAAAQAIKEQEPNASVVIIGNESVPPYMRYIYIFVYSVLDPIPRLTNYTIFFIDRH